MRLGQIAAFLIVVGIIGLTLALGVLAGYGINSEKTATTVEQSVVTVTPYCCVDSYLNNYTSCEAIVDDNIPSSMLFVGVQD